MSTDYRLNGGAPTRPRVPPAVRPPVLRRPYTDADYRRQREMMNDPRATWDEQYDIPPRPWHPRLEAHCEDVRLQLEAEDYEAEQQRQALL
ncbi:hypothetical protein [Streptomyces sp. NPDC018055]|uniref:hypothetical protein n=1 Tax=Streptomyces sp. NPDC018055 TaxID=3365038 RepID=UPI00379A5D00